jgi:hypothetical protein
MLRGRRACEWSFMESIADLRIAFEENLSILIHPYPDYVGTGEDAWALRMPGKHYGYVTCKGEIAHGRSDAVPEWFSDNSLP